MSDAAKELADLREEVIDAYREAVHSPAVHDPYLGDFKRLAERLEDEGHGWERHVPSVAVKAEAQSH